MHLATSQVQPWYGFPPLCPESSGTDCSGSPKATLIATLLFSSSSEVFDRVIGLFAKQRNPMKAGGGGGTPRNPDGTRCLGFRSWIDRRPVGSKLLEPTCGSPLLCAFYDMTSFEDIKLPNRDTCGVPAGSLLWPFGRWRSGC